MHRALRFLITLFFATAVLRGEDARSLWSNGIEALLDQNCVKCHGPLKRKSGLQLDTIEAALKGNEDGAVLVPGKPDESKLIAALAPDADPHMPPKKQLAPEEIAKLRTWISALVEAKPAALEEHRASGPTDTPQPLAEPVAAIDYFLAAGWQARGITPAPLCDDRTFVRRICLDLAGRIPTPEETSTFLFDAAPKKREVLVDRLLASNEYARTFREIWDVLLMGRSNGRREQRRRENGWFTFLENVFKQNRPWNDAVHAIIAARPETTDDKGALWFLFERRNEHQRIAEAIAPVIYGTRVDCAQCHDHPLAREIKQAHYWGLVAAFNRSKNVEKGAPAVAESAVGGFVNFTNLKKESQPALLAMLTGRTIEEARPAADSKQEDSPDAYLDPTAAIKIPKFSRRGALADAATRDNPLLARSFVNHTWAILMGRGIVHPVDEMNSKNKPSHPELLEWLSTDFATHNYDIRRLVRAIVLSRGYQLAESKPSPAPEAFAAAAERPLTAESIVRSARLVSGRSGDDAELRKAFLECFPEVLPRVTRATIQQAMFLAGSERLSQNFKPDPGTTAERLGNLSAVEARVREAFRVALIREPADEELAHAIEFLEGRSNTPGEATGQLLWTLVTGPEFLTNH